MKPRTRTIICIVFFVAAVLHIPLWMSLMRSSAARRSNNNLESTSSSEDIPEDPLGQIKGVNDDNNDSPPPYDEVPDENSNNNDNDESGADDDSPSSGMEDTQAPPPPVSPIPEGPYVPITAMEVIPRTFSHGIAASVAILSTKGFPDACLEAVYNKFPANSVLFEVVILFGGPLTELTPARRGLCTAERRCSLYSLQRSGVVLFDVNIAEGFHLAVKH
eukprot:PhF_6_TR37488/c0_g1_i2/m.55296